MFPNKISTRDLLSGSQSMQDHSRDFSQLQNAPFTQFEMSQPASQDFFSQQDQYSAGSSQDLPFQSQERKVASYEKYMSKPLFGANNKGRLPGRNMGPVQSQTHSRPMANPKSCQQQINAFKNKTKEKEERDMLSSIVCIVKECSDEVKQNLHSIKEADQDTGATLKRAIEKLSSTVEESSDKILKAIHSREELINEQSHLQQDIRKKDEKIQELLKQNSESSVKEVISSMQDAIKAFLQDQHNAMEQKLQRLMETGKEQLKLIQDIGSCQQSGQEDTKKQHNDLKYKSERHLQETEERLQRELGLLRDDFDRQRRDMESFCKNQLQSVHQKYTRDINQQINQGLEKSLSSVSEVTKDFCRDQQSEIRGLLRQQKKDIEASLIYQNSKHSDKVLKQNQDQNLKHLKEMKRDIAERLNLMQTNQEKLITDNEIQLRKLEETFENHETDRPWHNDNVPKQVQEQLNELHNTHMAEIKRLEKEIEQEKKEREQREAAKRDESNSMASVGERGPLENVYDFADDDPCIRKNGSSSKSSMFGKDATFLSPRPPNSTVWNSKAIFSRANPSPIATVLPQRKSGSENPKAKRNVEHNVVRPQVTTYEAREPFSRQLRSNSKQALGTGQSQEVSGTTYLASDDDESTSQKQCPSSFCAPMKQYKGVCPGNKYIGKKSKPGLQENVQAVSSYLTQAENTVALPFRKRGNQPAVEQSNQNSIGFVRPVTAVTSDVGQQDNSLYDFNDEISPIQLRNRDTLGVQPRIGKQSTIDDRMLMSPESGSSDLGSSNSSPSVSITEVFIRRRVRREVKTPSINDSQTDVALPDFLSTPNLTELFTDQSTQRMDSTHTKRSTSARRQAERRKLCDFDTEVVQTIQRSSKRSRH